LKRRDLAAHGGVERPVRLRVPAGWSVQLTGLESNHAGVRVVARSQREGERDGAPAAGEESFLVRLEPTEIPPSGPVVGTVTVRAASTGGERTFATTESFKVLVTD
jgi:hypothetical protein